jgi:CrcB protein
MGVKWGVAEQSATLPASKQLKESKMSTNYLVVGLGGALGAMFRVALAKILPSAILGIPLQIMLVNILGCFAIGIVSQLMSSHWQVSDNMRYLLIPGFLGGFTTFSSFALEFGVLCEKNKFSSALIYALLSVVLGICLFFVGVKLIKTYMPVHINKVQPK